MTKDRLKGDLPDEHFFPPRSNSFNTTICLVFFFFFISFYFLLLHLSPLIYPPNPFLDTWRPGRVRGCWGAFRLVCDPEHATICVLTIDFKVRSSLCCLSIQTMTLWPVLNHCWCKYNFHIKSGILNCHVIYNSCKQISIILTAPWVASSVICSQSFSIVLGPISNCHMKLGLNSHVDPSS